VDFLVQWTWKSDIRGLWALLQWELRNLARSWMLRLWLLLTALVSILLAAVSADAGAAETTIATTTPATAQAVEAASQLFSNALSLYLTFGSVVFIVLSASSVASERGWFRTPYCVVRSRAITTSCPSSLPWC
jgi:ABC-type transport system involved in multi-copper enzyme maturation permease subunit